MKTRLFIVVIVAVCLLAALSWAAAAQGPEPRIPTQGSYGPPQPDAAPGEDKAGPFARRQPAADVMTNAAAPNIALGEPGMSFRYERTFGETEHAYLADTDHLNFPFGLGSDGSNIWVAELFGHRALKYNAAGGFLASIGAAGFSNPLPNMATGQPHDVTVDAGGNVWIAYDWGSQVGKFDASGKLIAKLGSYGSGDGQFQHPASIAFDTAGNVYVSDGAPFWGPDDGNQRVQIFDAAGHYLSSIGTTGVAGAGPLQFHGPRHIAIYGSQLYVADVGNHRVQVIDISNPIAPSYIATLGTSGQSGNDSAHLNQPSGVAVDDTYIYVADTFNDRVQVFSRATRAYVDTIGSGWGTSNGQFKHPADLALDGSGTLYVADWVNCRVQVFSGSRQYVRTLGATGVPYLTDGYHYNTPAGVALAPDGSIYLSEDQGHRLVKLNSGGTLVWAIGAAGLKDDWNSTWANDRLNNPQAVWTDGSVVYVADQWHGRVQIYGADSSYRNTIWGLNCPRGVTVRGSIIYVAETCSHTVRMYNQALDEIGHLGQPGQAGADNAHFNSPAGVAVDSRGFIYVSDSTNSRIQVFDASRAYLRTIGQAGVSGYGLGQFNNPQGLAVDAANRLYVADRDNNRVQVFNPEGAYLTTIGGSWGNRSSQFRGVNGVTVDGNGNVFITDWENHRVQKFAPGVPGWRQVNINGFGQLPNRINALTTFGGQLYAGAYNQSGSGAQLWRMDTGGAWTPMITNGFGITRNVGIDHMTAFNGQLYAGIWSDTVNGGEIWRSNDGQNWARVVSQGFGDPTNTEVIRLAVFSNTLYATTWSRNTAHGLEIWRSSDGQSWSQVVSNGLGDVTNRVGLTMEVFNGALYAGTYSWDDATQKPAGCEVWRTADGTSWAKVITDGFGSMGCYSLASMAAFQGYLYAGTGIWDSTTRTYPGGEIWRCSAASGCDEATDWTNVATKGFNNPNNYGIWALMESGSYLYAVANNFATGMEVWRTADGTTWAPVSAGGFGDSNNAGTFWDNSVAVYNNRLYVGSTNSANGGEIWVKTLTADFAATPTRGAPPLNVQFANTSSGDFTTSQWNFGDGGTSTAISPTHTYSAAGTYTVTLTVGDGTDTSTITKTGYIDVHQRSFLPLVFKNYDPYLYDDFNNSAFDGKWDPAKWAFSGQSFFHAEQSKGTMIFWNMTPSTRDGASVEMQQPKSRTLQQLQMYEARLKMGNDQKGTGTEVGIVIYQDSLADHPWIAECRMYGGSEKPQPYVKCHVRAKLGGDWRYEYGTSWGTGHPAFVDYETWHTVRIEADPSTANLCFYLDGVLLGGHTPNDAAALKVANRLGVRLEVWNSAADDTGTRYVDDVHITPAR